MILYPRPLPEGVGSGENQILKANRRLFVARKQFHRLVWRYH